MKPLALATSNGLRRALAYADAEGKIVTLAGGWDESQHPRVPAGGGDRGGEFSPADAAAVEEMEQAFTPAKERISTRYRQQVESLLAKMQADLGPELKNVGSNWTWSRTFRGTVVGNVMREKVPGDLSGMKGRYLIDEVRLTENAKRFANQAIRESARKALGKLGAVRDVKASVDSNDDYFDVSASLADGRRVRLRQHMILNVSSQGTLFNQWPARLTVDGKSVSEAKYKKGEYAEEEEEFAFDPNQPRDKDGQWANAGGRLKAEQRVRLKALGVPPAWTEVQISVDPKSDLQVTGVDAKGRKQYLYSAAHSERAAGEKFARLKEFNAALPAINRRIAADLARSNLPAPQREAASALRLIERTGFRVGSDNETGGKVQAFGATTLRAEHVVVKGSVVSFDFLGKHGVRIQKTLSDAELASDLKLRVARGGRMFETTDSAVRNYLHSRDGDFKVKDFRTWIGTSTALREVSTMAAPKNERELAKAQVAVSRAVAAALGNTPAVARSSYIDPAVWSAWRAGVTPKRAAK